MTPKVAVSNDELVTVREAMRGLNQMIDQLTDGEREKFVLMRSGKMVALVIPIGDPTAFSGPVDEVVVLDALRSGPANAKQLGERLGSSTVDMVTVLKALRARDAVVGVGRQGRYRQYTIPPGK